MPTLDFKGKNHIYAHHLTVPYRPLQLDESRSILPASNNGDVPLTDQNLIIHGDNLHALKALLPHYAGRVKCIYIDPPYNTGNEGWVYNDNVNSPMMQEWLEKQSPVDGEDLERHEKWLCMMWPRLHLLRELLRDDGVIFVSIDDNEVHNLRMLMTEVFGEENFVTQFVWQSRESVQNDTDISVSHEYIMAFARIRRKSDRRLKESNADKWYGIDEFAFYPLPASESRYSNDDNDPRGPWKLDPFDAPNIRENLTYEIVNELTGQVHLPPPGRHWRTEYDRYRQLDSDGRIVFGKSGNARPSLKVFYEEKRDFGETSITWLIGSKHGTATSATKTLQDLFGGESPFDTVKPVELIGHLINLSTRDDDLVLDSFAGSGTTAQAVLALNKEDGGNRRFILVECEDYADSITAERVRRVIRGVPGSKDQQLRNGLGGSFAYCTLGEAIDVDSLLEGGTLPSYSDLASYLLHTATGISASSTVLNASDADGHFYASDTQDYYLIYEPRLEFLRSSDAALNLERAERIRDKGRSAVVFAAADFIGQRQLSQWDITFCQLPYELGFGG